MYIIDKNNDYYDHISYEYGVDKKVIYDRRGSQILTDEILANLTNKGRSYFHRSEYLLLEIGFTQYLIDDINIKNHRDQCNVIQFDSCDFEIVHVYKNHKNYFNQPISIRGCRTHYFLEGEYKHNLTGKFPQDISNKQIGEIYNNPIIKNTGLTKIIDNYTIWKEVSNYISSLNNDKNIDLKMNDKEKAEQYGFDKTAFRKM